MNSKGQTLIEYLIIVAVIAIGSIFIVRGLGETVKVRFANITNALQDNQHEIQLNAPKQDDYSNRGLTDFFKKASQ
jgi:pilus assembly protein Flp/PilA